MNLEIEGHENAVVVLVDSNRTVMRVTQKLFCAYCWYDYTPDGWNAIEDDDYVDQLEAAYREKEPDAI